jgi:predicted unusual protein kinase regulating ubiquinone biosynthesis (AarF/ABC1/UbiB family)
MPPQQVSDLLKEELGVADLTEVFEWIELERPLGSASIAQVHKAKLRQYERRPSILQHTMAAPWRAVVALTRAPVLAPCERCCHALF